MASRWMQPKLDKLRRDGMAAPVNYSMTVGTKAANREMLKCLDDAKVRHVPAGERRSYHARNEPRFDKRTFGNFERGEASRVGLHRIAWVAGGSKLIPAAR